MLMKRSRVSTTTSSKVGLMGDHEGFRRGSTSSLFNTPRLMFTSAQECDCDSVMSPTSILDTKPFSKMRQNSPRTHWSKKLESKGVGHGIADAIALTDEKKPELNSFNSESPKVLLGSQLKIQIPPLLPSPFSPAESPRTPVEFGIKTRNSQLKSGHESIYSPRVLTACLSASEMEMSEDYTCVISHGPVPKTTHIFDNCIVESCCGVLGLSACRSGSGFVADRSNQYPSQSFLSFCHTCKKKLEQGSDIYMYRGEKAFCSGECRDEEMLLEERMDKLGRKAL